MKTPHHVQFSRRYRAALLDYLLAGGEAELVRAYDLGRMAIDDGLGLLLVLRTHQQAVAAILESTPDHDRDLRRFNGSHAFLTEALSAFEMTHRGYLALIDERRKRPRDHPARTRAPRHR